jgi:hypothetical protein
MHYSARVTIHSAMKISPGALTYQRDMLLDIPIKADLYALQQHRQLLIDKRLIEANRKRISHDYEVGQKVLKLRHKSDMGKFKAQTTGPYEIIKVHTNGNVTIKQSPYQSERINIRRLRPFWEPNM